MSLVRRLAVIVAVIAALWDAPHVFAQPAQGMRFSNWEFTAPPMLEKSEQTSDRLVFRLDRSIPGAGGSVTLVSGRRSSGALKDLLDAEWKELMKGKRLLKPEPDEEVELADGSRGLTRSARTDAGGVFSLSVYKADGGVNFLVFDARDEMASEMLGGTMMTFFMTARLHPAPGPSATAKDGASKGKKAPSAPEKAPESPTEELARLNREMSGMAAQDIQMMPDIASFGAVGAPSEPLTTDVDPIPVPSLDKARIASIPKKALRDGDMPGYINETVSLVEAKLSPEARRAGDAIVRAVQKDRRNPLAIERAAIGFYSIGALEGAIYLMGKAAAANPADPTTLNNYAAFLSMGGAEQRAVAMLQNLERKFPDDTTVLNNLGQAWFGLGDAEKAQEYFGRVIRLKPGHSQANMTDAVIKESRGDKKGAVESMRKSIRQGYSREKEAHLGRLGYELTGNDISWDEPFAEDPLKLHKALPYIPPYYTKAKESKIADERWNAFREAMKAMKEEVDSERDGVMRANESALRRFQGELVSGKKRFSPMSVKFTLKHITRGKTNEELMARLMRWNREGMELQEKIDRLYARMQKRLDENRNAPCGAHEAIISEFMGQANTILSHLQSENRIKDRIRWYNEWAQILRYYNSPTEETYRLHLNHLKSSFFSYMAGLRHYHFPDARLCHAPTDKSRPRRDLVHYEDIHCQRRYSFAIPMIGEIKVNCHYMATEFDVAGVIKGKTLEDLNTGEFVRGTLEVGAEIGKGSKGIDVEGLPISVEMTAKTGGFIEFDGDGITDIGVEAGVEATVSTDVLDKAGPEPWMRGDEKAAHEMLEKGLGKFEQSLGAGVSTRFGVNSGISTSGSGVLSGLLI